MYALAASSADDPLDGVSPTSEPSRGPLYFSRESISIKNSSTSEPETSRGSVADDQTSDSVIVRRESSDTLSSRELGGLLSGSQVTSEPSSSPEVTRYKFRAKRVACPLCGKFFFDLQAHASECGLKEEQSPRPTTNNESKKKKKAKIVTNFPEPAQSPTQKKRFDDLLDSQLPSDLPPVVPENEANRKVIQRERSLFAAAAAMAAETAVMGSSRPGQVELVEVEPGVTILASPAPLRDGLGQGLAFTLRTEMQNLVDELFAVRESDVTARMENEQLRKLVIELKAKSASALEQRDREKQQVEEMLKSTQEAAAQATSSMNEVRKELKRAEKETKEQTDKASQAQTRCTELEAQVGRLKEGFGQLEASYLTIKKELDATKVVLETTKSDLADALAKVETLQSELDNAKQQDFFNNLSSGRSFLPEIDVSGADTDEYTTLLKQWLMTHNYAIATSALAIFHGTKDRAGELWKRLAPQMSLRDLIARFGIIKGISLSDDDARITLIQEAPSPNPLGELDFLSDDVLGLPMDEGAPAGLGNGLVLDSEESSLVERVASWLEEKNGYATWNEFQETFASSFSGTKEDLSHLALAHRDEFFLVDTGDLVLTSLKDAVLVDLFCKYLKATFSSGATPASRYAHFLETTPGILQIRERISKADSKLASLARKFPDKIHFWREGDTPMCCVAEERARIEREKVEKKRVEEEGKREEERRRLSKEKQEAEERARLDWEQRRAASAPPPVSSKFSRWTSGDQADSLQAQPDPVAIGPAPSFPSNNPQPAQASQAGFPAQQNTVPPQPMMMQGPPVAYPPPPTYLPPQQVDNAMYAMPPPPQQMNMYGTYAPGYLPNEQPQQYAGPPSQGYYPPPPFEQQGFYYQQQQQQPQYAGYAAYPPPPVGPQQGKPPSLLSYTKKRG